MVALEVGVLVTPNIRLVRPLGRGRMGSVWVADHLGLDTPVAVKFVSAELARKDPKIIRRFRREAKAAAKIRGPHVVEIKDYGVMADEHPYIVMELLVGETLADRLAREGELSLPLTIQLIAQTAQVLGEAHAQGIVHRDITLENIFLLQSEHDLFVKVLDFGIAKICGERWSGSGEVGLTSAGAMMGTPEFMSPEQVAGEAADHRSDLWSLGVIAYAALTAKLPFTGPSLGAICVAIAKGEFLVPGNLRDELPLQLDDWFERALSVNPNDRFQSARQLAKAFASAAQGKSHAAVVTGRDSKPSSPEGGAASQGGSAPKSSSDPAHGPRLWHSGEAPCSDRFTIRRELGRGGMGVVYEAVDRQRNLRVALKTLRQVSAQALYRFKNEFRALQDLQHPNLVRLGELVEDQGQYFFTMEYIDGVNLDTYLRLRADQGSSKELPLQPTEQLPELADTEIGQPLDYVGYQRQDELPCNELRLRAVLPQLVAGLCALHAAGKVHRDIKPSNIRITPEGRLVLVDFGLITETKEAAPSTEAPIVGTVVYMAPEQATEAAPVGPASDWYSVGVVLYEALTGKLPHAGTGCQVLINKQQYDPLRPRDLNNAVPGDLDALTMALLCRRPEERLAGPEVLRRLGVPDVETALAVGRGYGSSAAVFVGREAELDELNAALAKARAGHTVAVLVRGASGVGKTELLRQGIRSLLSDPDVVVLRSRCYERESVPFNALDGAIDGLSHYMRKLPPREAAELVPRNAALLPRVFPVLERVSVIAQAPRPRQMVQDPLELSTRAFSALRELLSLLAERRTLVLLIDDLQWADADSWKLLSMLVRPPEQVPLLLLASTRQLERPEPQAGQPAEAATLECEIRELLLGPLPRDKAEDLAERLLEQAGAKGQHDHAVIAEEAGGHPIFIEELVHHSVTVGQSPAQRLRLEDAIQARVATLDPSARLVLELVCLADALPQDIICAAARAEPARFVSDQHLLRAGHLVRTSGGRQSDGLESYHDRVREAVVSSLDEDYERALHNKLATALEGSKAARRAPELLMRHLEAAGRHAEAARCAEQAAPRATQALAFEQAADLYTAAMALRERIGEPQDSLLCPLAEALSNAGRGKEAADIFLQASGAEGEEATVLYCMRRAAELYLASGYPEQGIAAAAAAAEKVGLYFPSGTLATVLLLLWLQLLLRLSGYHLRDSVAAPPSAQALARCRVCYSCATSLALQDLVLARVFQVRNVLLAVRLGRHEEASRALIAEIFALAVRGRSGLARARKLVAKVSDAVAQSGSSALAGHLVGARGMIDFNTSRFAAALAKFEQAEELFLQSNASGDEAPYGLVEWPSVNVYRTGKVICLQKLGSLPKLARCYRTFRQDAIKRGDRFHERILSLHSIFVWLAADDVATARQVLEKGGWHNPRTQGDRWRAAVELYDDPAGAYDKMFSHVYGQVRSSMQQSNVMVRNDGDWLLGRLALGKALDHPEPSPLRRFARRCARRIAREPYIGGEYVHLLRATIASQEGADDAAVDALREALQLASQNDMGLIVAAAKQRLGEIIRGDEGAQLCAESAEWMVLAGVKDPERITQLIISGFRRPR